LDYGLYGIFLMLMFYTLREKPAASFAWVFLYMVWHDVPGIQLWKQQLQAGMALSMPKYVNVQFYAVLALPLIYIPFKTGVKINKYFFYVFYPAHLALIYLLTMG